MRSRTVTSGEIMDRRLTRAPALATGLAIALGLAACGPSPSGSAAPAAPPASAASSAPGAAPAASSFENPGGMWMPSQMAAHAATLKKLGLEIDPAMLATPTSPLLQAIVSLGGCSASFVSPDGLIITNHHCVAAALAYHSKPDRDLTQLGHLAKTRADELWNGPTSKVWVTQQISDVTPKVLADLDKVADDRARYDEIEKRTKALIAACEKDRPGIRCSVASFFEGAEYQLIENLELRDVRLVYAPSDGIGRFGGEIDNWMWPRHTGDFAFLRAYVGKDGKPADHAVDNVPFKPTRYLKIASRPLHQGDLAIIAGYPGRTNRLATAADAEEALSWFYPTAIARFQAYLDLVAGLGDKDAALKAEPLARSFSNYHKNYSGKVESLGKGGVAESKKKLEGEVRAWIAADAGRQAKYGDVFVKLDALTAERLENRDRDADFSDLRYAALFGAARTIVRMAEERSKPDAERDPAYQERNWKLLEARLDDLPKKYSRTLDRALVGLALERAARNPVNADWLAIVAGGKAPLADRAAIDRWVARLYARPALENDRLRLELFRGATSARLKKHKDPLIQLAVALRPIEQEMEDRSKRIAGGKAVVMPRYIAVLREHQETPLAPDANSTLRITYGTVRGYQPRPGAEVYRPFTTLSEMVAKHQDKEPFDLPEALLAAAKGKRVGGYADPAVGDVPVDFLSDLDITGGNSGSATLDARGDLIGLAFDGNLESMGSDWVFSPAITRTIHVDIRFIQWIMDAVDGADHLLIEMGVKPSID
jgi:hypothetical protein